MAWHLLDGRAFVTDMLTHSIYYQLSSYQQWFYELFQILIFSLLNQSFLTMAMAMGDHSGWMYTITG